MRTGGFRLGWQAFERIDCRYAKRREMPRVPRENCQSVPTCSCPDRKVPKARVRPLTARHIGQRARDTGSWQVKREDTTGVQMQKDFKPRC